MTLEHVMPQAWKKNWPITQPQVVSPENGETVADSEEASQLRALAIYEIGNMTLLSSKLNSTIRDGSIRDKIDGKNGRPGVAALASQIHYTKEVIDEVQANGYVWNEKLIRDRTNRLTAEFLATWGVDVPPCAAVAEVSCPANVSVASTEVAPRPNDVANAARASEPLTFARIPGDEPKIGKIARAVFPVLFAESRVSDADVEFLQSDAARKHFKNQGNQVLKETTGNIDADSKDVLGRKRFYSDPVLRHGGKRYLLTSQWFREGKENLVAWFGERGINAERIMELCS